MGQHLSQYYHEPKASQKFYNLFHKFHIKKIFRSSKANKSQRDLSPTRAVMHSPSSKVYSPNSSLHKEQSLSTFYYQYSKTKEINTLIEESFFIDFYSNSIFSLPLDIWFLIVDELNFDDILKLRTTCHWFRNFLNHWVNVILPHKELDRYLRECEHLGWVVNVIGLQFNRADFISFDIFSRFSSLKVLDFSWCNRITNEDLKTLTKLKLEKLNLTGCIHITDEGIKYLPPTLKELNLERCTITDEGLKYLPHSLILITLPWTVWLNMLSRNGIRYLIDEYPKLRIQFGDNHTALYWACDRDCLELVKLLLKRKEEIKRINHLNGVFAQTSLYNASMGNQKQIVQLLLEHGANPNIPNIRGVTPLIIAYNKNHKEIVNLLLRYKGNFERSN